MSKEARHLIGSQLAALYRPEPYSMPLEVIELLARFAVAEAMVAYDRRRA